MNTILIDMDGTIADVHTHWLEDINSKYGTNYKIHDFTSWDVHKVFNLPEDIYKFIDRQHFFLRADPIEGSQEVLEKIFKNKKAYIVSAASYSNHAVKEKVIWLNKYYPFIPKNKIIFAKDKSAIAGDLLIDDAIHNVHDFHSNSFLFNQPWNQQYESDKVRRVHNWNEIDNLIFQKDTHVIK